MEIESWIINWLEDNAGIEKDEILKKNEENYLELGWIDSLKFISFITDIEETFKIRFSNDVFQDRDFSTVKGLSKIINGYSNEQN
jgi:acyl carrier protein